MIRRHATTAVLVSCLVLAACSGTVEGQRQGRGPHQDQGRDGDPGSVTGRLQSAPTADGALSQVSGPRVVAVGDIACEPGASASADSCRQAGTARLARSFDPRRLLLLGDLQYQDGRLAEFQNSFAKSWGRMRARIRPVPGNHEYHTRRARGYYRYFQDQSPPHPGYYSFRVGSWRVYALNDSCDFVDCDREERWLDRTMSEHPARCSIIMMHRPRYSSGAEHGSSTTVKGFWEVALRHRTDIALAGHDHGYERFRRMDADRDPARRGLVSFVSGAGGKSLYDFARPRPGSQDRYNKSAGVLVLRLGERRYAWKFRTVDGRTVDAGVRSCV